MIRWWLGVVVASACLFGCGNDVKVGVSGVNDGGSSSSGNTGGAGAGGGGGPGGSSGEWQTLIAGDWTLAPGSEAYTCVVASVPEDMWISKFRPIAPDGTHHTVLTRAPSTPEGTFPCDVATNGQNMIYGSGVGVSVFELPAGVAVKVEAGDKLLLNLHLFNASTDAMSNTSGVEVQVLDPADVEHEADAVIAGTQNINLAPMSAGSALGTCTMPSDVTLFGLMPHMHQLGVHMNVSLNGTTELLDLPYTFDDQFWTGITPLALQAGDQIVVDCSYNNTTNQSVSFGDSSTAEMCFSGLFVYPSGQFGFICDN